MAHDFPLASDAVAGFDAGARQVLRPRDERRRADSAEPVQRVAVVLEQCPFE